jgi:RNA polymerase sigma-70 factor (ECF subfamily)
VGEFKGAHAPRRFLEENAICRGRRAEVALTQAAFDRLVSDHGSSLYRMAFRMIGDRHEAEDIVQETYRSAWTSRAGYQSGRSQRAWLASILRRRVVDRWRKNSLPGPAGGDYTVDVEVAGTDPLANDFTDEMQHALNRLPLELRESLLLVVVGELTHQEVADMLSVPLGTVLSRVSRARERLREYWLIMAKSTAG